VWCKLEVECLQLKRKNCVFMLRYVCDTLPKLRYCVNRLISFLFYRNFPFKGYVWNIAIFLINNGCCLSRFPIRVSLHYKMWLLCNISITIEPIYVWPENAKNFYTSFQYHKFSMESHKSLLKLLHAFLHCR